MNFSDGKHQLAELVFQGVKELDPDEACTQDVIDALGAWNDRPTQENSGSELLRMDDCPLFSISYDGVANGYWPSEPENDISETLIREFLYHDGICTLEDNRPHLFHAKYRLLAMNGADCLLVCPYLTAAGNIYGVVVITVTKKVRESFLHLK